MLELVMLSFIGLPFYLAAIAYHSWPVFVVGISIAILYFIIFLFSGFSEFVHELRAYAVDEEQNARFQELWKNSGPTGRQARFWIYPSSEAQFKVWVRRGVGLEIFLSLGLIQLATDSGLKAAFKAVGELKVSDVRLQNRRHALSARLDRLKGPKEDFRFWFLAFWLYPLERILKIAKL